MNPAPHQMTDLFAQLGLPSEPEDIQAFIQRHRPLSEQLRLADAPIWDESQATFLKEKLREDSDWAMLIDSLSEQLRAKPDLTSLPKADTDAPLDGEGNITAARRYNAATQAYVDTHDVAAAGRAAAPRTPMEAQELKAAEAAAAARAAPPAA